MYAKYIKRMLDFILSFTAIVFLSPLLLILYCLVRVKLGSPVLFHQERPGRGGKIFTLCKFRTMTEKKDENGELLPDEERLTPFGKFLRSTSLDELPELFNILKGDMSLVGPRPLLVCYLPWYTEEESHRHDMRPGLTGLAQVNGRNALGWEERFAFDLDYVNHCTFLMDVRIIMKTIGKVMKRSGILSGAEQTLDNFDVYRKKQMEKKD
ncbi:MAG: sugar transferase [Lachnospiraceae bacterium]|nr:sugar transferase [Lachnospiraceae bacterium]